MKRWLGIAMLAAIPASASVTLTIPITTVTPTAPRGSYIRADIVNCQNPTILNSGTTIPLSQQFPLIAGSTGTTITIPDNVTQIACDGNQFSYYTFTYVANGVETILKSVELPQGVFNLANLAPLLGPPWNPGVIQGPPGPPGASTLLLTNEVPNANQVQLDLKAGTGIVLNNLAGVTTITNSGSGGSGSPGGTNGQIQYNNSGAFGGSAATITAGGAATIPSVNTVINAGSSLSAAITACGSANTTIQITQTIAVGSGITVPANCTLLFQSAGNLTGTSITIRGKVQAAPVQIFGAGLAVTGMTGAAFSEWFGAKAYPLGSSAVATAAAGANDAAAAAATIAAIAGNGWMELRCYAYHFDTVAITTSNTGITGECTSKLNGSNIGTVIVSNSAGGNIVSATGASSAALIVDVTLQGFYVQRAVTPTGTAAGIFGQNVDEFTVRNVQSGDSIFGLYSNFTPSSTNGGIFGFGAHWGESVVSPSALPSGMQGIWLDSSGGNGGSSLFIYQGQASCQNVGSKAGGILASGISVTDFYIDKFSTGGCNIGIDLENTGTSGFVAQDVLLTDNVLNTCVTNCLKINGMQSTTDIAPHVYVKGGNMFATGGVSAIAAFIENSTNVSLTNVQIFGSGSGSAAQTDIVLNTVNGFQINDNDFSGGSLINISCISSTNGTITGNKIKNNNNSTGATGIKNVGCTNVAEQGNTIAGNGGVNLLNGITFDATSSSNGPWSLNTIDSATVTTPITDAGTGNNTLKPTILVLAGGTPLTGQSSAQSQIVTCPTGGTTTQYCGADGAWHAAGGGSGTVTSIATTSPITGGTITSTGTIACPTCGVTGSPLSQFAATTSTQLAGVISDETGTGSLVFGTSPTLVTPLLGTPTSGVITNLTGTCTSCNVGGTAANLSGTPALPNGTTATTQSAADNSTKLATTAYADRVGTNLLSANNTWTGTNTYSTAGAASAPPVSLTGTWFSGGTATTTKPQLLVEQATAASTGWATAGTGLGINSTSAFAGNALDIQENGVAKFTVRADGFLTTTSAILQTSASPNGFGGQVAITYVPTASTPALLLTQPPFAGTGTTSTPMLYISGTGTPSTWSTAGTYIGVNSVTAFAGNFLDFHAAGGASLAKLDSGGNLTVASCTGCGGGTLAGDVTGAIGANTVVKINGGSVPASANLLGTNSSSQPVAATGLGISTVLSCADTSASGTVQTCTTSPSFTPAANSCVIYTTTTANTGAGLTLNVNSLGAKSVAKWLGSTTLVAGDVAANSPQMACYNGTVWNLSTIGNAPGGGGTPAYPLTITGGVSGGVVYGSSSTQLTVSPAGTATHMMLWGGAATAPQTGTMTESGGTDNFGSNVITTTGQGNFHNALFNGTFPISSSGIIQMAGYQTFTNCSSAASPAVCGSAASGNAVVAAASTTVVVNTSAVTASSQIQLTFDSSLGTKLSVTCNTTPSLISVSARTAGTSFTVTTATPAVNPACFSYTIIN